MHSFKPLFSRFLAADPGRLHFAAHSHHLWPDVSFEAQQACWQDAAELADAKWGHILGTVYPAAQAHVARILGLPDPATVAFGPNTHDFVVRILSCLPGDRPLRLLTTDGEFLSFARQLDRLAEDGLVRAERVPVEPFDGFAARFAERAAAGGHDLVFFSQVFFSSGFAVADPAGLVEAVPDPATLVVIDGYHGFMAVPTDLSGIAGRAFYLAGGYKYAMAGEGVAFLHAPPGVALRPRDTGWYAGFAALESGPAGQVGYASDGTRFLGATFDPVGLYRLRAVCDLLEAEAVGVAAIHRRAAALQQRLIEALGESWTQALITPRAPGSHGNFLTFRSERAAEVHRALVDRKVATDHRGDRLRIGFGLYHDPEDVERLCGELAGLLE